MSITANSIVDVRGIGKSFGENRVLNDVALSVQPSQVVVIIGPSGSGKSTLLRCCNALEVPQEGSITICGTDLVKNGELIPIANSTRYACKSAWCSSPSICFRT
jgi:polar amino acid transport system ATP-binding protein